MSYKTEAFADELKFIKNPVIREFTENAIEDLPEYFFKIPASSTGKYHPAYTLGDGGLLRHVRAVARIAVEMFALVNFTEDEEDLVIASLLLHDGRKSGLVDKEAYTRADHPLLQTFALKENSATKDVLPPEQFELVCSAIDSHMGQWNTDFKTKKEILPKPRTRIEKFVHMCDYIASRKMLEMNFDVPIEKR